MSLVIKQKQQFPPVFAVWRPHLDRWQICRPQRNESGEITGFRSVWRPWASSEFALSKSTAGSVCVNSKELDYFRVGVFRVQELVDRSLVKRNIPAISFIDWRHLPRSGL
jgi:hypothetical protein